MSESTEDSQPEGSVFQSKHYFDISDAVHDLKWELKIGSAGGKALSGAKLIGKSAANVGLFAGKLGLEVLKRLPEQAAKAAADRGKKN